MARIASAVVACLIVAGLPTAVLAFRGVQERSKVAACSHQLSQLWKAQIAYSSEYGGRPARLPGETGEDFWLKLLRTPTPLLSDSKLLVCPVSGDKEGPGVCSYRGPKSNVNLFGDSDPVGADKDGNHGAGRGGNVLGKHGVVETCSASDLKWIQASKMTAGKEREKPADVQEEPLVENPEYLSWATCKPGTFIVLQTTHKSPVEEFTQEVTVTLQSVDRDQARLLRKIVHRQTNADREGKMGSFIPAKIPAGLKSGEQSLGTMEIEVEGTRISCTGTRWSMTVGRQTTTVDSWTARDIPGLLVLSRMHQKSGEQEASSETRLTKRGWAPVETVPDERSTERKICVLPEGTQCRDYVFAAEGCSVAFVARKGDREFVVHDGKVGPEFAHVTSPCLSANGRTLAYGASPQEGKFSLIVGPKRWDDLRSYHAEILLTPDGEHHLAAMETPEGWKVVVDGKPGPASKQCPSRRFLARDGGHGYAQTTDDGERLVINGVARETGEVLAFAVGTGGTFAYAVDGDVESGIWHNGRKIGKDFMDITSMALSSDGKVLGLMEQGGGKAWLHLGDRRIELGKKAGWLQLSADGSRAGFWVPGGERPVLGVVSRGSAEFLEGATRVILDPELAWLKEGKDKVTAVVGGREIELPGYVGGFELTPEGIGYGAVAGTDVVWRFLKR